MILLSAELYCKEVFVINTVGIIAEYNPFHNGHFWHADEAKRRTGCQYAIAVMSGQFTQRGEPAILDKWLRAALAVTGGVDLVLELPAVFAVRSAQYFAAGGVRLIHSLGIVSHLAFGSENPDLPALWHAAEALDAADGFFLRRHLLQGMTYASALTQCLAAEGVAEDLLAKPNNMLGVEYLRAIRQFAPSMQPLVIPRRYAQHHDSEITSEFASASAVRRALLEKNEAACQQALPANSFGLIQEHLREGRGPVTLDDFSNLILYKLRTAPLQEVAQLPGIAEGLHHKMIASALEAGTVEELLTLVKSKRYARTRLQRSLIHLLLGVTQQQAACFDQSGPLYARVLAFNENGRKLLKEMTASSSIPVITKTAHFFHTKTFGQPEELSLLQKMLAIDVLATDIYALAKPNIKYRAAAADLRQPPVYID